MSECDTVTKKDNYLRFIIFFIDVGKATLLKVFAYVDTENPGKVIFPLAKCPEFEKKIRKLFPKNLRDTVLKASSPADLDISILSKLLRNLFPYLITEGLKNDVEHLRRIRNDYLAHPTEGRLSNDNFEHLWQEAEMIFNSIIDEVDPGYKTALETTIKKYKNQTIDATKAGEYIRHFERQVGTLRQELCDSTKLCKNKQTPYLRYVRILLDGGYSILSAYLCKLLEKPNVSLERLLHDNHALILRELNEWVTQQLYSGSEDAIKVNTNTKSWDLSVLATVLELIFGEDIEEYILTSIKSIRYARENYAYMAISAITSEDKFSLEHDDLVVSLNTLAVQTGQVQEFKKFLRENMSSSTDSQEYFAKLKRHGPGIKDIIDLHKESVEKLKAETGSTVLVNDKLELEVMLQIACEDSSKQAEAESLLQSVIASILANPKSQPDFPDIRITFEKINNIPTVRLTGVQKSCLLLTIECRSNQGLLNLITFIDGSEFLHQLEMISVELMDHFDDIFLLHGHFTLESLVQTLMCKDTKKLQHEIELDYEREQERNQRRELQMTNIPLESRKRPDDGAVIRKLNIKLESMKTQMRELQDENSTLQMRNDEVIRSLRVAKGDIDALRKERSETKSFAEQDNGRFKEMQSEIDQLQKVNEQLVNQADEEQLQLVYQINDTEAQVHDLKEENTQLTKRLSDLEKGNTFLANQKQELEEENRRAALEDESQRRKKQDMEEMDRRVSNQLHELRRENSSLTFQIEDLRRRNSILTNQKSELKGNELHLTNKLSRMESEMSTAERKQLDSKFSLERLDKQKAVLKHEVEQLKARYSQSEQHRSQREKELRSRLAEAEDAALKAVKQSSYEEHITFRLEEQQKNDMKELLEKSERKRERLTRQLHESRQENNKLSAQIAYMNIRLSEAVEKYQKRFSKT